jgi:HEAT repeat protein
MLKHHRFLVFALTFILVISFSLPWVSAKEKEKPKPQDWQINGIVAALDDGYPEVQGVAFQKIAGYELKDFDRHKAENIAKKAVKVLKDKNVKSNIRSSAADALRNLGEAGAKFAPDIPKILKDEKIDQFIGGSIIIEKGIIEKELRNRGEAGVKFPPDIFSTVTRQEVTIQASKAETEMGNLNKAGAKFDPDILNILKDKKADSLARGSAASALGNLGDAAKPYVKDIADILKDEKADSLARGSAVSALGNLGDAAKPYVKDIADILKDQNADSHVRISAVSALGSLGDVAKPYIKDILNIIKDRNIDSNIRYGAASALGSLGDVAKPYVKDILDILKDQNVDRSVRASVTNALGQIEQLQTSNLVTVIDNIYYAGQSDLSTINVLENWRFLSYLLGGGSDDSKTLLKWVGLPERKSIPTQLNRDEAIKILKVFSKAWQPSQDLERLREDLAEKISLVVSQKQVTWQPQDILLGLTHCTKVPCFAST